MKDYKYIRLLITIHTSLLLSSCLTMSTLSEQATSLNTECDMKDVKIYDEIEDLNSDRTWTAKCNGKTYYCELHDSAGSYCDEM